MNRNNSTRRQAMTELLPVDQAEGLTSNLLEFLGTTFSLDPQTNDALVRFLTDEKTGMFRGPYARLRLPFAPAESGWEQALPNRPEGFTPYGHQAAAFKRLSSANGHQPQPTVVTTGTGSGKTESFLLPILDHIVRANHAGESGTKAIILYPMNALANDQARRLTDLLTSVPQYQGITAALYTGEAATTGRTKVTRQGLITNREVIRSKAPDILLTNYKMLDQLLLRHADAEIWSQSAESLAYLVIDEFHSYDGAQGTDVAMLLRRLGMALGVPADEEARGALGKIVPVATSATLGDDGDPSAMLNFFRTVTGAAADIDTVVTETRLSYDKWSGEARPYIDEHGFVPRNLDKTLASAIIEELDRRALKAQASTYSGIATDPDEAVRVVLSHLYVQQEGGEFSADPIDVSNCNDRQLLHLLAAHPLTDLAAQCAQKAVPLSALAKRLFGAQYFDAQSVGVADLFTSIFLSVISHLRAVCKHAAISVDVHVWIRELTRVDRSLDSVEPGFRWSDDGVTEDDGVGSLPAIYCRSCGRSGWGALLEPTGNSLTKQTDKIRGRHAGGDERFRALIFASGEAERLESTENLDSSLESEGVSSGNTLTWLNVRERVLTAQKDRESDDELFIPVLTHTGLDAGKESKQDVCPSCGAKDSIRFLGSAIATQLSVTISGLLATKGMDDAERRALVFTDSVQDAAHRAGFVQARSYALTLRSLMRECLEEGPLALIDLPSAMMEKAGRDATRRYALLPPELADRERFEKYWRYPNRRSIKEERLVGKRLALDVHLEFGLRNRVGRTLEATGAATAEFTIDNRVLLSVAGVTLEELGMQALPGFEISEQDELRWIIGVLQHMRARGAIEHEWWKAYRQENGARWRITGGRKKADGMPGFRPGISAPSFPVSGAKARLGEDLEPVASSQGWYAIWTSKVLRTPRAESAALARILLEQLAKREIVSPLRSTTGHLTYALSPDRIVARAVDPDGLVWEPLSAQCDVCDAVTTMSPNRISQLANGPCLSARCNGTLRPQTIEDNYYRRRYCSRETRRVVAREHTSLLPTATRLKYENDFKEAIPEPDAPNVLVATPTLEMGIDIGDLSSVLLASLPRSVASYLQRVGRAGRLTGNALTVAFVTARGDQLPRFFNPDETINGAVRPPATYLNALEILKRQYLASVGDQLARDASAPHPKSTVDALKSVEPGSYLATLIEEGQKGFSMERFLRSFASSQGLSDLTVSTVAALKSWALDTEKTASGEPLGSTALGLRCQQASSEWNTRIEELGHRLDEIEKALPEIQERASAPAADEESKTAFRTAQAAQRLTKRQIVDLKGEYWISAMESFGLFPNYTLIDDSVSLEVGLSWLDPDTQEYRSDDLSVERASSRALKEFAPGSTFYTQGYAIDIDAVDLGTQGERIHTWACCPACGHVEDLGPGEAESRPDPICPRCGNVGLGDLSQRLRVVDLKSVSAAMRRDEAVIDDRQDDRKTFTYNVVTLADIDTETSDSWFVAGRDFGVRHSREIGMRWINLGPAYSRGVDLELGGGIVTAPLFRVCEFCGKLDEESGMNTAREHRPWCPVRHETKEHAISIALARHLTTEGLLVRVPQSEVIGESSSLPSLAAALLLALREYLGGAPDHLQIVEVADPSGEGQSNPTGLLIYDTVPGGTGYLAELADPNRLFGILAQAYSVLLECSCAETDLLACEKCLLPFASASEVQNVSRVAAIRTLSKILGVREDGTFPGEPWPDITREEPLPANTESYIEQYFRKVLKNRVTEDGGGISENQGARGSVWRVSTPNSATWRMEPQVDLFGTRPDFVLTSANPENPETAIFIDGRSYHFSRTNNRVADDAEKRQSLRNAGYRVLSLTSSDLEESGVSVFTPEWYDDQVTKFLMLQGKTGLSRAEFDLISASPIELVMQMMKSGDSVQALGTLAQWIPFYFFFVGDQTQLGAGESLSIATYSYLKSGVLAPATPAGSQQMASIWRAGTLAVGAAQLPGTEDRFELAVILDDSSAAVDEEKSQSWREWLRLANLVGGRMDRTTITTTSLIEEELRSGLAPAVEAVEVPAAVGATFVIPESWEQTMAEATRGERAVLESLLREIDSEVPVPEIGMETTDGIPLGIAWPEWKVAIAWDGIDDDELAALADGGWKVIGDDPGHLIEELAPHLGVN
ncbi:DEAD/DEAH box helicase [Actinomycetaceae bacterium L2_0104]